MLVLDEARRYEPAPLLPLQEAAWVGRDPAFELGGVAARSLVELDVPDLDPTRLEAAIELVLARHDVLRTTLREDGRQVVLPRLPPTRLVVEDLRGRPVAEVAAALEALRDHLLGREGAPPAVADARVAAAAVRIARTDAGWRVVVASDAALLDARSELTLVREVVAAYRDPASLPPSPTVRFRDLVAHQIAVRQGAAGAADHAAWMTRLAELPAAPVLPLVTTPSSPRFATRARVLEARRWGAFRATCDARGVRPAIGLLAAWTEALATYARQPRFTVAVAHDRRAQVHADVDRVLGALGTLALFGCEGFLGIAETARRLAAEDTFARAHTSVSAIELLRELGRRAPGRALAPYVFTDHLDLGAPLDERAVVTRTTQCSQVLIEHVVAETATPDGPALATRWHVVEAAFPPGLIDGLWGAFHGLVDRLADGHGWDEVVDLAPERDRRLILGKNATEAHWPEQRLEAGVFAAAARWPERVAVVDHRTRLTYAELAARTRGVAWTLIERGARADEHVAVLMEKGWPQVVGVVAVNAAGAPYVPLDAHWPIARIEDVLARARVKLVLTDGATRARLAWPPGLDVIDVETIAPRADAPPAQTDVRALAYTIFTSGSTGRPKGVMIDHRGAGNTCWDLNQRHRVGPGDATLGVSSLTFDLSVYDIFGILWAGATLVLPASDEARAPDRWLELVEREGVTIWDSVPALMELLTDEAERSPRRGKLRTVWMSGDWIPTTLPDRIMRAWPGCKVVSMGGATEGSIWSIEFPIHRVDPAWRSIPYGHALANQSMWILDERGRPRPTWVPGEIHIGGVGVALGYLGQPELTAERFIEVDGLGRLYRTGDWGRMTPDGELEFLGRVDGQVKIGGLRIEVGEIEAALVAHPAVGEAVVVAREDRPGVKRLVAYVVPTEPIDIDELARAIALRLPSYMMPAVWVGLEELPLSLNGKVDRGALPAPDAMGDGGEAPESPLEQTLVQIWMRVLDRFELPADRGFYQLGGTSLDAVRMLALVKQEVGVRVTLGATLGAAGTVRGLAALIANTPR